MPVDKENEGNKTSPRKNHERLVSLQSHQKSSSKGKHQRGESSSTGGLMKLDTQLFDCEDLCDELGDNNNIPDPIEEIE